MLLRFAAMVHCSFIAASLSDKHGMLSSIIAWLSISDEDIFAVNTESFVDSLTSYIVNTYFGGSHATIRW